MAEMNAVGGPQTNHADADDGFGGDVVCEAGTPKWWLDPSWAAGLPSRTRRRSFWRTEILWRGVCRCRCWPAGTQARDKESWMGLNLRKVVPYHSWDDLGEIGSNQKERELGSLFVGARSFVQEAHGYVHTYTERKWVPVLVRAGDAFQMLKLDSLWVQQKLEPARSKGESRDVRSRLCTNSPGST